MRVTNGMLARTLLADLDRAHEQLRETSQRMASGRRIDRPSDDPLGASRVLELDEALSRATQHGRATQDARAWLDVTDSALGQLTDLAQRARELALRGANGTSGPGERESIALEIDQLAAAVKAAANASFAGRYVFAGTLTGQPPYRAGVDDGYYGDTGAIDREVSAGVAVRLNVTGAEALGTGAGGLISTLRTLASNLRAGNTGAVGGADLAALSAHLDTLISSRTLTGARASRVEVAESRLRDVELSLRRLRSETADADLTRLAMEYSLRSAALQSALQAGATTLQPSLMDFLD